MKGLILDRKKYIIERSVYDSIVRRLGVFVVLVFIIGMAALFGAVGINRNTITRADDISENNSNQYVEYEGEKVSESYNDQSNLGKQESDTSKEELNKTDDLIIKKDILENYYVTKIVDGDTIYVSGIETRIRLIGINTPEIHNGPVQCYGPEASDYLAGLILGKYVGLEYDAASGDVDIYGRPLRYIYYNGENVNQKILLEGYGKEASYGSEYKYRDKFVESEKSAITNNKGLWSPATCNGQE